MACDGMFILSMGCRPIHNDSAYSVSSVEGWIGVVPGGAGTMTATIYTEEGAGLPGAALYSQIFSADEAAVGYSDWQGAYGLGWDLAIGTFWLAFDVRPTATACGFMNHQGTANPL